MPPKECGPKSFSDNQKLTLSDVYIYNEFCGTIINKDEGNDKPVTIPTATPIPESFENIEIELKIQNDEYNQLYDSEYLYDESNGFFQFKDHFTHRKYEFTNDKFLLDSMINILSSASN